MVNMGTCQSGFEHSLTLNPPSAIQVQTQCLTFCPFNLSMSITVQHCDLLKALSPGDAEDQPQLCPVPCEDTVCAQGDTFLSSG